MKSFSRYYLFFFAIAFWLQACSESKYQIIKEYYYPVEAFTGEGIVYEYRALHNDSLPPEYWHFQKVQTDTALYLIGRYYDEHFFARQFFRNEIVGNGVLVIDQSISIPEDPTGVLKEIPAKIIYNNAFPFEVQDSTGVFLMQLKWVYSHKPPRSTTLTRNRRYFGKRSYMVLGKEREIAVFRLLEEVEDQNEGHWTQQYDGIEYYAKKLGLVYYKKNIDDGFTLEYALYKTYPFADFKDNIAQ